MFKIWRKKEELPRPIAQPTPQPVSPGGDTGSSRLDTVFDRFFNPDPLQQDLELARKRLHELGEEGRRTLEELDRQMLEHIRLAHEALLRDMPRLREQEQRRALELNRGIER